MEVIDALITIAPRDAYKRTSDGSRRYASVYRQAVAAGLLPARTLDDAATLHAIFDLAVDHGFGSWVLDYVEEVCSDEYCTSNDPVEAYLVDGDCVLVSSGLVDAVGAGSGPGAPTSEPCTQPDSMGWLLMQHSL
jgi:hypothetical protein